MMPCLDCGQPAAATRCPTCAASRPSYDQHWRRLSTRARRLSPLCQDCGATTDLTGDHSPEAWDRRRRGLPIRLTDVAVTCRPCNSRRGPAR